MLTGGGGGISVPCDFGDFGVFAAAFRKPLLGECSDCDGGALDALCCAAFFFDELDELRDGSFDLAATDGFDLGIELSPVGIKHNAQCVQSGRPFLAMGGESLAGLDDDTFEKMPLVDQPRRCANEQGDE